MPRHQQLGELCDVDGHPVQKGITRDGVADGR